MAAPSYVTDQTDIIVAFTSTTGWTALGGGASGLTAPETDYFVLSNCISKAAFANSLRGMVYNAATTIAAGDAVFIWTTHLTPNSLDTQAGGGLRVTIGSGTGARDEFFVMGSDDFTVDVLNWPIFVVDPTATPDATVGSPTGATDYFGVTADMVGGPTKGAPLGIGGIRHGRELTITAGDLPNGYATISGAAAWDNNSARRWGHIVRLGPGFYRQRGLIRLGSASTAVDLRDSGGTITIPNTLDLVPAGFHEIIVENASSNVELVAFSFVALGTTSPGKWTTLDSAATVLLTDATFVDYAVGQGIGFGSGTDATGATFRRCGTVTQSGAELGGTTFDRAASTPALIMNDGSKLDGASFVSAGTGHAIRDVQSGNKTLTGVSFSGYAGTDGSTGNEAYFNDTGGAVTLTIAGGGNVPSVRNGTGASTTIVVPQVTVTFTNLPVGAEFRIYDDDGDGNEITLGTDREGTETLGATSWVMSHTTAESGNIVRAQVIDPLNFEEQVISVTLTTANQTVAFSLSPEENI